jgi:hypothetical protein
MTAITRPTPRILAGAIGQKLVPVSAPVFDTAPIQQKLAELGAIAHTAT